jgi:hypothetical protein
MFVVAKMMMMFGWLVGWLLSGEDVDLVQQVRDLIAVELLHVTQISPQLLHLQWCCRSPQQTAK